MHKCGLADVLLLFSIPSVFAAAARSNLRSVDLRCETPRTPWEPTLRSPA
jgi:hypothetical protein